MCIGILPCSVDPNVCDTLCIISAEEHIEISRDFKEQVVEPILKV